MTGMYDFNFMGKFGVGNIDKFRKPFANFYLLITHQYFSAAHLPIFYPLIDSAKFPVYAYVVFEYLFVYENLSI